MCTRSPRIVSGAAVGVPERQVDGVANAEAHAQMIGADDLHSFVLQSMRHPKVKRVSGRYCLSAPGTALSARQRKTPLCPSEYRPGCG